MRSSRPPWVRKERWIDVSSPRRASRSRNKHEVGVCSFYRFGESPCAGLWLFVDPRDGHSWIVRAYSRSSAVNLVLWPVDPPDPPSATPRTDSNTAGSDRRANIQALLHEWELVGEGQFRLDSGGGRAVGRFVSAAWHALTCYCATWRAGDETTTPYIPYGVVWRVETKQPGGEREDERAVGP
ncbi:hypothetical protein VTK73DRAFT_8092 [Phialemonium thermophilum]|uniref:Uncharacterized protein n=1 Tax=Phialemonium thermophilum TaxID=223376 RepID=A0ABR3WAT9_9PEZI